MGSTTMRDRPMARKVGRPKKPSGEGTQVRIERDLASMSRSIADFRGVNQIDYLSGMLRPGITRDYRLMIKELDKASGETPK